MKKFDFEQMKPFTRVLIRNNINTPWRPAFFAEFRKECDLYPFKVIGESDSYKWLVPYKGHEDWVGKCGLHDKYYDVTNSLEYTKVSI